MYRAYPNVSPVANKYLGYKHFLKAQADHEYNIKNARAVSTRSDPIPRLPSSQHLRKKQVKEYELTMIEQENKRLRTKMSQNRSCLDTHNNYVLHSLNTEKRQRQQAQHDSEFQRLQKQISQIRPSYSAQKYQRDWAKYQDVKKRMSRFPPNDK